MYEIKIPILKVSLNQYYAGKHWTIRKKHKDTYKKICNAFKQLDSIDYKVDIKMHFFYKSRALDSSNNAAMFKMVEDCLVEYKVLKDDTYKNVGWVSMKSSKTKEEDHCIVYITKSE